jgi:hypothetical protein
MGMQYHLKKEEPISPPVEIVPLTDEREDPMPEDDVKEIEPAND